MLPFAPVSTSLRFTTLSAGRGGACGTTTDGQVACWGSMSFPFVRDAAEQSLPRVLPTPTAAGRAVSVFATNRSAACMIDDAGATWCWGDNPYRALPFDSSVVFPMRRLPDSSAKLVVASAGEAHGCGVSAAGALLCWGAHSLATSTGGWFSNAIDAIPGVPPMATVATGFQTTCALDRTGGTWCGGYLWEPTSGQADFRTIARKADLPAFTRLDVESDPACGLTASGEAWCWRLEGLFAGVPYPATPVPARLSLRHKFVEVGAGSHGACGVTTDGKLLCRVIGK